MVDSDCFASVRSPDTDTLQGRLSDFRNWIGAAELQALACKC